MLIPYLKRHIKIIVMILIFVMIFSSVFYLYRLPLESILYSALLCLCVGIILFVIGYLRHLKRHKELVSIKKNIVLTLENLPEPSGTLEADYQELLSILFAEKSRLEFQFDAEISDLTDYYTLWAHQIKTPIAAMNLILQNSSFNDEHDMQIRDSLSVELLKIEQYVEMVLSYLRLDSISSDYVLREYDLDSIIRQAVKKYAKLFIMKKISLDFNETGLTVLTDEKWLLFIIEQLLSNALKYTAEGKISIYSEGLCLFIKDTGIGIRQDDIPRVFEKGFTGYNGREDKKATGIGLYLCRRICSKIGHTISIESSVGTGTCVCICFEHAENVLE